MGICAVKSLICTQKCQVLLGDIQCIHFTDDITINSRFEASIITLNQL